MPQTVGSAPDANTCGYLRDRPLRENVIDGDNNWFVEVVDQGFYFKNYAIYPAAGSQDKDLAVVTDLKARETASTSAST